MGKYGKGKVNENGYELLEFCMRNELVLSNTTFQHKYKKITTWQCPENSALTQKWKTSKKPNQKSNLLHFSKEQ